MQDQEGRAVSKTQVEEKREAILEAGKEVLFEYGYLGASVDEVLRRVGGSKRTIYKYFESKEGLFGAIVTELVNQAMQPLEMSLLDKEGELYATLEALGQTYLDVILREESVAIFRIAASEGIGHPTLGKALFESGPGAAVKRLAAYLHHQNKIGVLAIKDIDLAARHYYGMVRSDLHMRALLGLPLPAPAEINRGMRQAVASFVGIYEA
ncbi:MAG TPA: TetR/AcrR family transcriptional regulator [Porticoccaceae bacterium]|nr:TetR/AcrR family transcriptional regulator [Porticoccaceae bacterium]HCO59831.1 TetR/AcrR family transcriptional regulator [Porticoccaceae bacterium]